MGTILYEVADGVGRITLDRPDALNSFNAAMAGELAATLDQAAGDAAVRALLLTGSGRAFSAGQDLDEVKPVEGKEALDFGEVLEKRYNPVIRRLRGIEKLVVCAVNGVAAGAGANVALACDLVLASTKASFVQAFAAIGLVPDSGGTFFLPRLVGLPRAAALMYLGERISAEQAFQWGMIHRVCEPAELLPEAAKLAKHLATRPTKGLGLTKRALNRAFSNDLDAQLDLERDLQAEAGRTHDYAEGVRAFLEKRAPKFEGR